MPKKKTKSILTPHIDRFLAKADIRLNGDRPWDIKINDSRIFRDTLLKGTLGFGDGYAEGLWDCEQLDVFFEKIISAQMSKKRRLKSLASVFTTARSKLINTQIGRRAFQVGEAHYDLGNSLYELMLGPSMSYSCAVYNSEKDSLSDAQENKFRAICEQLHLKKGMRILEIGSGWGSFAKYAIEKYGVSVVGLTVSKEQKKYSDELCKESDAVFLLQDYQTLDTSYDGTFDRVVSIEMIEAVGRKNFRTYFKTIERVLREDGLALIQAIVGSGDHDPFLSTRIFPNGLVPSEKDIIQNTEGLLRLKKWTSFGTDYDKTLLDWDKNFRENWSRIKKLKDKTGKALYDDNFYRLWRYYLMCCAGSFRAGLNDDAHILLSKLNASSVLK